MDIGTSVNNCEVFYIYNCGFKYQRIFGITIMSRRPENHGKKMRRIWGASVVKAQKLQELAQKYKTPELTKIRRFELITVVLRIIDSFFNSRTGHH